MNWQRDPNATLNTSSQSSCSASPLEQRGPVGWLFRCWGTCPDWFRHQLLIVCVGLLVFFTNLGGPQLWDRDEPRNAGCAEEMLARGDWVVPTFNGQLRDAKPVLLYWLIMSAYGIWGVGEFAARFWSAALALGTLLATYHLGRRVVSPSAACWGVLMLASCLMFDVAARAATPDSLLIFCSTAAMCVFVWGAFPPYQEGLSETVGNGRATYSYFPQSRWLVLAMYGLMGLGVLAKGPVGFILPTAAIGLFLLLVRLGEADSLAYHRPAAVGWTSRLATWLRLARTEEVPTGQDRPIDPVVQAVAIFFGIVVAHFWGLPGLGLAALTVALTLSAMGRHGWVRVLRPFEPSHFFRTAWSMRPVTAGLVVLAVALPWYVWVGVATEGEFLEGFFLKEHLGRASTAMENHDGSPLYYPVAILIGFFPWSIFAAPIGLDLLSQATQRRALPPGITFLLCWSGLIVGAFTIAETKLPSYVTPSYPALALLAGHYLNRWLRGESPVSVRWNLAAVASLAAVGLAMTVAFPFVASLLFPGEEWLFALGLIPLFTAAWAWRYLRQQRRPEFAVTLVVGAVLLVTVTFGFALERVSQHQLNRQLLDTVRARGEQAGLASFDCLESSWVFYAKRPILEIQTSPELQAATDRYLKQHPEPYLITTRSRLASLQPFLPDDFDVIDEVPYFLRQDQLLLLGPRAVRSQVARMPKEQTRER